MGSLTRGSFVVRRERRVFMRLAGAFLGNDICLFLDSRIPHCGRGKARKTVGAAQEVPALLA